jgi:hypothetical protein
MMEVERRVPGASFSLAGGTVCCCGFLLGDILCTHSRIFKPEAAIAIFDAQTAMPSLGGT